LALKDDRQNGFLQTGGAFVVEPGFGNICDEYDGITSSNASRKE
jgi:hypothetical protein